MNGVTMEKKWHNSLCLREAKSYKLGTGFGAMEATVSSGWLFNVMLTPANVILHVCVSSPLLTGHSWWAGSMVVSPSYAVSYMLKSLNETDD